MLRQKPHAVDILILGAGWTSTFLIRELEASNISHGETTTTGRDGTIPFKFDPQSSDDDESYRTLPSARTVLVTFPLVGPNQAKHITSLYRSIHGEDNQWIQLGSTGIFNQEPGWSTEDSAYDCENGRAIAEDELRGCVGACVLNLAGLYGGSRKPSMWLPRLAQSKEEVRRRKAVHFVHGEDVARAIVATHAHFTPGKRWIVADLRVYDWYDLIMSFSALAEDGLESESEDEARQRRQFGEWVGEIMVEDGIKALPRELGSLGRRLDSRGFWMHMGIWPRHGRLA